jgi:AcrR family transcriptional regulator
VQDRPAALNDIIDGPLPSGRHSLTRDTVLASQRGRLLDAMAEAVAEHSYGATTIAHVVARAGVSRKTFYEHFSDKQDCFLAMYDIGIAFVLGRIVEELEAQDELRGRLVVGLETFLSVLSEEPAFCRSIVLEVQTAGPEGLARRRGVIKVFAERYLDVNRQARAGDPAIEPLSEEIALAVVGAILELVGTLVDEGRTAELPDLAEPLSEFVVRNVLARA